VNLLSLDPEEKVLGLLSARGCFDDGHYLVLATRKGLVKRTVMSEFESIRSTGKIAVTFQEGDELIGAAITAGVAHIFLGTKKGQCIVFPEDEVRPTGRTSRGVIGIRLRHGDEVVQAEALTGTLVDASDEEGQGKAVEVDGDLLTVTERGYGKRTPLNRYRVQGRGGYGIINIQVTAKNGLVVGGLRVMDGNEIMVITSGGQVLRTPVSGISRVGRRTQGFRVITLTDGDLVAAVARFASPGEEGVEPEVSAEDKEKP
jgi:DNA gyrase subunit A